MKTVQLNDRIERVDELTAEKMINSGWSYVPKSVWKAQFATPPVEKKSKKSKSRRNEKKSN